MNPNGLLLSLSPIPYHKGSGFRFLLRRMLAASGHEVREVADGDAAIACLCTFPAQVAIVDLFMPGKEGIENIIEIRCQYPEIKIIAMSGGVPQMGTSFLSMAQKLGANRTLSKPFFADGEGSARVS